MTDIQRKKLKTVQAARRDKKGNMQVTGPRVGRKKKIIQNEKRRNRICETASPHAGSCDDPEN